MTPAATLGATATPVESPAATPSAATPTAASPSASVAPAPAVGSIDPTAVFHPDKTVGTLLVADDHVWAFDWTGVTRIDPATNKTRRFQLPAADGSERPAVFGAVGFGSIWVGDFDANEVRRYDETTGELVASIESPNPEGILVDRDAVWVTRHRTGEVSRIDPSSNRIVATLRVGSDGASGPERLAAAAGRIWVGIPRDTTVVGIDPATNKVVATISVIEPGNPCGDFGSFDDRLYVSGCAETMTLGVVDIKTMKAVASPAFDGYVTGPVTVGHRLWLGVSNDSSTTLVPMDPTSFDVGPGIPVDGGAPTLLLVGFDSMWVAVENESVGGAWLLKLPVAAFS